ncbi:uncharacterized protein [Pocillopora verrucosa]|uniref:uncharacterized protein isoform X1 n=1 Tax=Pocillopora verrucosa TaxID=203993 RepID=UPI00333EBD8A
MTLQPFTDEQLNYFKFASIVLNEFAVALRQTFKSMWDNRFGHRPGYQLWDNSTVVRNLLLAEEGGKSKVPTHISYEEWDCTALFQATIYARSFATPDSKGHYKTLSEMYVRHHKVPPGKFHPSVVSPSGNTAETFALAIDQLRLLRNSLCHADRSEIDKPTFDQYVQLAREAFKALGIITDPIDAIGGLTESDFPTKEVRKLEESLRQETRSYIECLEELRSGVECLEEVKSGVDKLIAQGNAIKEKVDDLALLKGEIDDLKLNMDEDQTDSKPFLPPSNLPSKVPHFTGRQRECEDISSHLTSKRSRIVSIWGSPGFGKTSVATEVGHRLQTGGLLVYFFSMRGLLSKADLTTQLLSFFRRHSTRDQIPQQMSIEEELFLFLRDISGEFVMILDNADELLESGAPNVKEDFINLLEVILSQFKNLTFLLTTRESLEFMNVHFEGHQAVRIGPLQESFSQTLVGGLLPKATASDCSKIAKICGFVPLAMKLLCSSITEDNAQPSQFLDSLKESIESNIFELLDNPDYPSYLRLKLLFKSSYQRLSLSEKEALVSLSVLSGDFHHLVAAAVMGVKTTLEAKKILHRLRRKSFLDSSSKPESFSMHKLVLSFVRERGQDEMKETMLNSKARLSAFYVSLFEKLNQQFLTGQSMQAFIDFYEEKQNIIRSLMESCSDPKTCDVAFGVLTKAEFFLDSLFWCEGKVFDKIYEHATEKALAFRKSAFYNQLLVSLAFAEVTWGIHGRSMTLLHEAEGLSLSVDDKRKILCYRAICQLVSGKKGDGAENLQKALSLMSDSPEERILRVTVLQILVTYFLFIEKRATSLELYTKALHECRALGDTSLLIIPPVNNKELRMIEADMPEPDVTTTQPLRLEMIVVLSKATEKFSDYETKQAISKCVLKMSNQTEKQILPHSVGLWTFQRNINGTLENVLNNPEEASKLCVTRIRYHKMTLKQSGENSPGAKTKPNENLDLDLHQEGLFRNYFDNGMALRKMQNYSEAIRSFQSALDLAIDLFNEEHPDTTECYFLLGITQHESGDFLSALQSHQRALEIRVKLFGEEHLDTARSYFNLAVTQHDSGDFLSALQSHQRALEIRVKVLGEEHPDTAQSYFNLGITQHASGDFLSALQSDQRTLEIRVKLFGEEHPDTARSYFNLAVTQHASGDFLSALQSHQRALEIRVKLFGEEHPDTAQSYFNLGITQHDSGDFLSALQSHQRALEIRVKALGEEHPDTAQSYFNLGITQYASGHFVSTSVQTACSLNKT